MERLQKVLAHRGVASRRQCEEIILAGRVKVNGQVVTEMGFKVEPTYDCIEVDGKKIGQEEEKIYILLNKPVGFVTTVKDPQKRKTVIDLIKSVKERVYPVGRLDYDTEGLLLMTNDGELAYALTHPKHEISKTYLVKVKGLPSREALQQLRHGVKLEDGMTAPAKVNFVSDLGGNALVKISIHEGRNRQVRRMFSYIGHPVLQLQRIQIGFLTMNGLKVGEFRFLDQDEIDKLKKLI